MHTPDDWEKNDELHKEWVEWCENHPGKNVVINGCSEVEEWWRIKLATREAAVRESIYEAINKLPHEQFPQYDDHEYIDTCRIHKLFQKLSRTAPTEKEVGM